MNTASSSVNHFEEQLVRPRPMQYETPESYLRRLCEANVIDMEYVLSCARRRRTVTKYAGELGRVIEELGGPPPTHFESDFIRSMGRPTTISHAFSPNPTTRQGCAKCCSGLPFETYNHHRYMTCLKHYRWLGINHSDPPRDVPRTIHKVERHMRKTVYARVMPGNSLEMIAESFIRHSNLGRTAPPMPLDPDALVDRYQTYVEVLKWATRFTRLHFQPQTARQFWHRAEEGAEFRSGLRCRLAPVQSTHSVNGIIDDLVRLVDIATSELTFAASEVQISGDPQSRTTRT